MRRMTPVVAVLLSIVVISGIALAQDYKRAHATKTCHDNAGRRSDGACQTATWNLSIDDQACTGGWPQLQDCVDAERPSAARTRPSVHQLDLPQVTRNRWQ